MRIIVIATLCALAALPAQAQKVERIKASGANAAGICAGSLEMMGQYLSRAQAPDSRQIGEVQRARDFFADLTLYPSSEISAAANAFIELMLDRLGKATTVAQRQGIEREILDISVGCRSSARTAVATSRNGAGAPLPPVAGTVQPYVAPPAQAPATQPYILQPSTVQPYTTQPLILDPIIPVR